MKKFLLSLVVLIAIAITAATLSLGKIVKTEIETVAPKMLETSVTVGGIDISLLRGNITINNLVIGNPKGFEGAKAISLGKIVVKVNVPSAFANPIIINEISIIDPEINYEIGLGGANINVLANNVNKRPAVEHDAKTDEKTEKKVIIKDLYIKQTTVKASVLKAESKALHLPEIHLTNIGKEGQGVSFGEVARKVFGAVMESLGKVDLQALADEGGVKKVIDGIGSSIKGLFQ